MWLIIPHGVARAQEVTSPAPKRVLLLNEPGPEFPNREVFQRGFQSILRSGQPGSAEFYSETLETYRFPSESHTLLLRDYLRRKYADMKFDVIAVWPEAALEFLLRYRDELFPGVPIVYITVKRPNPDELPHDVTGIWIGPKLTETLELALSLHPHTQQVFVIMGTLKNIGLLESEARSQLKGFESRVRLNYLVDLPLDEILPKVKNLPERSIIFYVRQTRGVGNKSITPFEGAAVIAQSANAPVYGIIDTWVGSGIVGGKVASMEWIGAELARMALRVANGTRPEDIPVEEPPTIPMFDWRQLRRFHISEDRLPADSVVRFKEFTFWELYKGRIIAVSAILFLQTLLLAGLLFERARKKRASRRLAESEERFAKAFKANPQPMSVTTLGEGRYLEVNESFLRMSGYTREEVIGHTSNELKNYQSPTARAAVLVEPLLRSGVMRNFEFNFRTKDGTFRTLLSSAELLELGGEKCILMASSDITERQHSEQQLAELTSRLLRTQEDERRNIARELHDVTAQNIGVIMLNLTQLQNGTLAADRTKQKLSESLNLGEQAMKDIRTLSYVLHPPLLDQAGLVIALKWLAKGFSERSGVDVSFTESGNEGHRMPPEVEYAFYRVVQECLTNIRRHTNSETAEVSLTRTPDGVRLSVHDEGKGHTLHIPKNGDDAESVGVGIAGMRHRLNQLGGELLIDSDQNGTTVIATVPVTWVIHDSTPIS